MSTKKNKTEKMRRALALALAILMVVSAAGTVIYYLTIGIYATDVDTRLSQGIGDDLKLRVGLMYGQDVTIAFRVKTEVGYEVVDIDRLSPSLSHESLWEIERPVLSCTIDTGLARSGGGFSSPLTVADIVVGGYHIVLGSGLDRAGCEEKLTAYASALDGMGVYLFPAFINGSYSICAGSFATAAPAQTKANELVAKLTDVTYTIAEPSRTAVSLVDFETGEVVFEYDSGDVNALGLAPLPNADGSENYLITPAEKSYDGIFMFRRYNSATNPKADTTDGVALTSVIELGDYINGVLPYEIGTTWPLETMKAFAICVRSFTLSGLDRHESTYQIDMCNTQHCQVYNGRARITDNVIQAVKETEGLVMTYGNEIITAFYSAVQGGVSVSPEDAWGGNIPYMQAVETPWEIFTNHSRGVWQTEVSPYELAVYLRGKGYTQLRGNIASIKIDELAKNSTYVKALTITDTYGNKVTLNRSDNIRTVLAKYLYSANFVVGKGEVEADVTTFVTEGLTQTGVISASGQTLLDNAKPQAVVTASGRVELESLESVTAVTATGSGELGQLVSKTEKQIIKPTKAGNFVFYGKGYGHGVGISQIGLRDLGRMGYGAKEMLYKYFTGIEIIPYNEIGKGE